MMEHQWRALLVALDGDHGYDRFARIQGWLPIWIALILMLVGAKASLLGSTQSLSLQHGIGAVGLLAAALWTRAFNRTRYRIGREGFECLAPWPRSSWRLGPEDVRSIMCVETRGGWMLALQLHTGVTKRIVLTRSMSKALDLA